MNPELLVFDVLPAAPDPGLTVAEITARLPARDGANPHVVVPQALRNLYRADRVRRQRGGDGFFRYWRVADAPPPSRGARLRLC